MTSRSTRSLTVLLFVAALSACGGDDDGGAAGTAGTMAGAGGTAGTMAGAGGMAGSGGVGGDGGSNDDDAGMAGTGGDSGEGGSGGTAGDGGVGGTGGEADTTAPTIVSVSPDTGALGVEADAQILITFSEPMDKGDTQVAYQSASTGITSAAVTFSWNDVGDVLTITPNGNLIYTTGTDPLATEAREYAFSLTTVANDVAGNSLAETFESNFFTLRRINHALEKLGGHADNHPLTGTTRATGLPDQTFARVGFFNTGFGYRSFFTIDLSPIPEDVAEVVTATLYIRQNVAVVGDPFGNHGELSIHDVEFDALDADAFESLTSGNRLGVFTMTATTGNRSYVVTDAVVDDLENRVARDDRSQFGLRFADLVGVNNQSDYVQYTTSSDTASQAPRMTVQYLVP